jgi:hypothetical protein
LFPQFSSIPDIAIFTDKYFKDAFEAIFQFHQRNLVPVHHLHLIVSMLSLTSSLTLHFHHNEKVHKHTLSTILAITIPNDPVVTIKYTHSTPIVEESNHQMTISIADAPPISPLSLVHINTEMDGHDFVDPLTISNGSDTIVPFPLYHVLQVNDPNPEMKKYT